jgi:hypothetical protein
MNDEQAFFSMNKQDLRVFLQEQWSEHTALFLQNCDSYSILLQAIALLLPNAGPKVDELTAALSQYQDQYQEVYTQLQELVEQVEDSSSSIMDQPT